MVEVKASLGFGFSSLAFFPPALAAEAALLFGGMILFGEMQMVSFESGQAQTCPTDPPSPRANTNGSAAHVTLVTT